jgi:hypothetical protein
MLTSHSRLLALAICLLALRVLPQQKVRAEPAKKTAPKTSVAKRKVELDMSILNDIDKSGVTMTEVPGKSPDKLGKLEIPFLGFVSVYSKTYILQAKEFGLTDQRWTLHWTSKGAFLGADFKRAGFHNNKPPGYATDVACEEEACRLRFSERIVGLATSPVQTHLGTLLTEALIMNTPVAPIDQFQIRRIVLKKKWHFDGKPAETYIATINSKRILPTIGHPELELAFDAVRNALNKSGELLWSDN